MHASHSVKPLFLQDATSICKTKSHGPAGLSAAARSFGASIEGSSWEVLTGSELGQGPQAKLQSPRKVVGAERAPALLPQGRGIANYSKRLNPSTCMPLKRK